MQKNSNMETIWIILIVNPKRLLRFLEEYIFILEFITDITLLPSVHTPEIIVKYILPFSFL